MKHQPAKQDQTNIPETLCTTFYDKCVGSLTSPTDYIPVTLKMQGTGPTIIYRCKSKKTRTSPACQSGTLPTELTSH